MSREMKDSGIEWIGEIPKTWRVCRLKDVGALYGGLIGKSGEDFNVDEEDSSYMLYVPFTNIYNNDSINTKQLYRVKVEQGEKQNLVQKGDLLFLMSSEDYDGIGKPAIMEEQIDNLGLNSFCKGLRVSNSNTNSKYLFYLLSSHLLRELVRQEAKGFIRINLRQDRLCCCSIFLPPLAEQQKIADYLDKVCGDIDDMIALQEKMIEELKAYKQSVITEAVTKGLNPNVPMRDSGIDWIGEIPEYWEVKRIKDIFILRTGTTPKDYEKGLNTDKLVNWFTPSDISEMNCELNGSQRYLSKEVIQNESIQLYPKGSLIFVGIGASAGKIGYANIDGYSNQQITAIILKDDKCHSKYFYYYMIADRKRIRDNAFFTTLPIINNSYLSVVKVLFPSLYEQGAIASFLDTKCSEIDSLIAIKQQKIEELKEYKKSIIYEYVTGKKQVN